MNGRKLDTQTPASVFSSLESPYQTEMVPSCAQSVSFTCLMMEKSRLIFHTLIIRRLSGTSNQLELSQHMVE